MRVSASLASHGDGVVLAAEGGVEPLFHALRSADPPIRARRAFGGLEIGFQEAVRLLGLSAIDLVWEETAHRPVENRRAVWSRADDVLAQARRIATEGSTLARSLILETTLAHTLDDHQAVNVAIMTTPGGWGGCVFDEQGTGKTVTTIAAFDLLVERNEVDVLLVVAPKSMVGEWATEIRRFTGDLYRVVTLEGSRRQRARALGRGADVVLVNYEGAVAMDDELRLLARRSRVVLVVDESFNIKNPDALRTAAVADIREWCTRAFVLCGTPAPNRPEDVIAQFDMVDFGYTFRGISLVGDPYEDSVTIRKAMEARGLFVRNLKQRVLPDLPSKRFTEVAVELAPEQRQAYEAALTSLILDVRRTSRGEFARRLTSFLERRTALLRICSNPTPLIPGYTETPAKLLALDQLLSDLVDERREKVVIWSFYRASLEALARRYGGYGIARIDGSIPDVSRRREAVRRFQEDDATMIFLGNPAAAGAGLTLHRGRLAIYESLSNQAAHYLQSLDRIHRRGQERPVEYLTLLCRDTIEEIEYGRLLHKARSQGELLGDPPDQRPSREIFLEELIHARELLSSSAER